MVILKRANLYLLWGLLTFCLAGCASKPPVSQLSDAQCDDLQLMDPQVSQRFMDQEFWVNVSLVVANTGPYTIRDVTIFFEIRGSESTIQTLTLKADAIEPFSSVILKGNTNTIREVFYYSVSIASCQPSAEKVIEEQGLSLETVNHALEAGDLELAESIMDRLYESQPDESTLNYMIEIKLASAEEAMDRRDWNAAETKLQRAHQVAGSDPRIAEAIRLAIIRRNGVFLFIGAVIILYKMVWQGLMKEDG